MFDQLLSTFILFIVVLKLLIVGISIGHVIAHTYNKFYDNIYYQNQEQIYESWTSLLEYIAIVLTSVLIIYTFNPFTTIRITPELREVLFLFGIMITMSELKYFILRVI